MSLEPTPGEDEQVTGSEAGRSRGGPRVIACRASIWETSITDQSRAAPASPTFPPTLATRMKMGRCAPEGAALSPVWSWAGTSRAAGPLGRPGRFQGTQLSGGPRGPIEGGDERPGPALRTGAPHSPPRAHPSVWATGSLTSQASAEGQACPEPFSRMKGKLISEGS